MTQPTHEQRLRDDYAEWQQEIGHEADGKHTLEFCIAKQREFVKEVRAEIGYYRNRCTDCACNIIPSAVCTNDIHHPVIDHILSLPLLQLEETNEK